MTEKTLATATEIKGLAAKHAAQLPFVEIHVLKTTAGELLNRDFHNRHKTLIVGGTRRARISSQAIKHAIRRYIYEKYYDMLHTRVFPQLLKKRMVDSGADEFTLQVTDAVIKNIIKGSDDKNLGKITSQNIAVTTYDCDFLVNTINSCIASTSSKDVKEVLKKITKTMSDHIDDTKLSVDTALFGRMGHESLLSAIYGAVQMEHPYSVNQYAGDADDFVACDDYLSQMGVILNDDGSEKKIFQSGAAYKATSDISSNTYYEYASVSERLLFENLMRGRTVEETEEVLKLVKEITKEFIIQFLFTLPTAKQHTMATHPEPAVAYITEGVGVYPHSMDLAFEQAVSGRDSSVCTEAVNRLSTAIYNQHYGAFAVNDYSHEYWLSDLYDAPEDVTKTSVRNLEV